MNSSVSLTSREEIEVHRFSWPVSIGIPVVAIFLQVFLRIRLLTILDLPLLVTIFFAVARRRPIPGMITGRFDRHVARRMDRPSHRPFRDRQDHRRLPGIVSGRKVDVENPGSRFLMTFAFVLIHRFVYMAISLQLVGGSEAWMWSHTLLSAW